MNASAQCLRLVPDPDPTDTDAYLACLLPTAARTFGRKASCVEDLARKLCAVRGRPARDWKALVDEIVPPR